MISIYKIDLLSHLEKIQVHKAIHRTIYSLFYTFHMAYGFLVLPSIRNFFKNHNHRKIF
ncbi:MAG: hypothetical protein Satyrvirus2_52 [Satyrvirus sp.]|uniref:Uncharacterized protein n=1 Tax=Satyrvirus sp. TaxID=2487771 RepID=A0A3G5AFI9_9VIRU|nr:MAG: hypothetical protein Satyrvirus2_52 [Satyrvirus sp.]